MLKTLALTLLVMNSWQEVTRNNSGRDYLIFGANTLQRIYYSTSSCFSANHTGRRAMDSNRDTSWMSEKSGDAQWIEIDFGSKRLMNKIVVYPGRKDNYRTIKYFSVQFLHENRWFDFATIQLDQTKGEPGFFKRLFMQEPYRDRVEVDLGGVDASMFRIFIPAGATYRGLAAIAEIETYIGANRLKYFDERLKNLSLPIRNGFLPDNDYSYPNAPRNYRGGKHVGLDIYYHHREDSYEPIPVDFKTPVHAAQDGIVIRADLDYAPMSPKEWKNQSSFYRVNPRTFVMRSFVGRQVWIDHENGIVTAYNHRSRIDPGIKKKSRVKKGERIGWVGNSGLYGEAEGKAYGAHLHFEIWVDGFYLGYGMDLADVKKYFTWIFSVSDYVE